MGNCNFKTVEPQEDNTISQVNFRFLDLIGKGGFSKVWKVEHRKTKQVLAMKMMSKAKIISKKSVHSAMNELQLLSQLRHPFLINMTFAFQDKRFLYLGLDYLDGGDLRYHLYTRKRFSEEETKFFIQCIVLSLEYLHSNSIIHRDVKPENLVFDAQGYLHLTDLGISRIWKPQNCEDTSGTPGYMAPEVMCRLNHGIGVDYYALGVLAFEMITGHRPYNGKSRQEIRESVLARQVQIEKVPHNWSPLAVDFTNQLIRRKQPERLGYRGPDEVKSHPWLADTDWQALSQKRLEAPYKPTKETVQHREQTDSESELNEQNELMLRRDSIQQLFAGYVHGQHSMVNSTTVSSSRSTVVPLKA